MTSKQFGALIRNKRKVHNYGFNALAKKTGISKGNLSKIENGVGNPCLNTISKLQKELGFSLS